MENFAFDPEHVSGPHIPGQGHAHIHVDGVKVGRAYCPWFHLPALSRRMHELWITLNTNDHGQLAGEGVPVEPRETLVIE